MSATITCWNDGVARITGRVFHAYLYLVTVCNAAVFLSCTSSTAFEHDLEETPDNGSQTGYVISTSRGSLEQHKPVDGNGGEELSQHGAGSLTLEVLKMDDSEVAGRIDRCDSGGRELAPNGEEDLGAGGVGAILSTPNVKTVLFLGCAIQVRQVRDPRRCTLRKSQRIPLLSWGLATTLLVSFVLCWKTSSWRIHRTGPTNGDIFACFPRPLVLCIAFEGCYE